MSALVTAFRSAPVVGENAIARSAEMERDCVTSCGWSRGRDQKATIGSNSRCNNVGKQAPIMLRRRRRICRPPLLPALLTEDSSKDGCPSSDLRRLGARSDGGGRPLEGMPLSSPPQPTEPAGLGERLCPNPSACASGDNTQCSSSGGGTNENGLAQ